MQEKILGIDPGTVITGYAVIETDSRHHRALDYGCIRPPPKLPLPQRHKIIFDGICRLIDEFKPQSLSIESPFVSRNPQSALKLGMTKGVIMLAATLHEMAIYEYAPKKAKNAIVGKGSASKMQVQAMVQMLLNLSEIPTPEDAADALALAICHAQQLKKVQYV